LLKALVLNSSPILYISILKLVTQSESYLVMSNPNLNKETEGLTAAD